ncbi:response regulator transcription factor [Mucilaginibacter ginsenosidivorans]|uniref:Response regulator transcription factor n=1 Tax=Mucilaginibacter ginsenosidivorans TaxID=398053 RepID=A0A5B8UZZ2_9SPHI|nr:response regulator transcription factor [Mucilaginibacter ginsenosidivorans]QEC64807.1 response regulator transcription factor [Mucilaginibacter ginsenosidivorans]
MMSTIKIAIVDDQKIFRQSLGVLLLANPDFELIAEADNGADYLAQLQQMAMLPDITILDMELPGISGMELHKLLQQQYPQIKILVLSIHSNERLIAKMIENGASGYLVKNCDKSELFAAINSVYHSGFYINQRVMQAIQRAANYKNKPVRNVNGIDIDVSKRETEILQMICHELNAGEIAEKLFISSRTVDGHKANLLLKTGCKNTAGLVVFAIRNGIVEI